MNQGLVAGLMPVSVIDAFEMIDVNNQKRSALAHDSFTGVGTLGRDFVEKFTPVGQTREVIQVGQCRPQSLVFGPPAPPVSRSDGLFPAR